MSKLGPIEPEQAARLAAAGVGPERIRVWVDRADLAQVKGIGEEHAELLELAGVTTTDKLAQCSADELHARLCAINAERGLVRVVPSLGRA